MKDPADELTPELPVFEQPRVQTITIILPACAGDVRIELQRVVAACQAAQRAVDALGAGKPKPRRVRVGGASRSASKSADKPERGAK